MIAGKLPALSGHLDGSELHGRRYHDRSLTLSRGMPLNSYASRRLRELFKSITSFSDYDQQLCAMETLRMMNCSLVNK
jgi:hypothetical protein